eukprot:TRINITY_DN6623_c0_g1_i1.p1 TRINITY_DN6623_c0_g1~~TRINITY_DN6623_c0_g1_i1.p1  ORF type:complete len:164 (-),score=24.71 TRINITY_DN6623_c0_g1_i1:15-506(-)
MSKTVKRNSVLFVCLGNICRSPMAQIVMEALVKEKNIEDQWYIDSAGTGGWHIGEGPDKRSESTCRKLLGDKMVPVTHKARQIQISDFSTFDFILCMDKSNLADLMRLKPSNGTAVVKLLGSYDPKGASEIDDPYYGGVSGFEYNFHQIKRSCLALIESLEKN